MTLETLTHTRHPLSGGGKVVVLNTGALIGPEAEAMLQALHSRSIGGIDAHLLKLAKSGAEKFMSTFYVGYGHKSIGDCGSATIFVEGVSMLVAKAIQDTRLYSGQEASTRYIDFATQPFANPLGTKEAAALPEQWRTLYLKGIAQMVPILEQRHPKQETEDAKLWQKAINARAFDIMRGFLPAGAATNLAWHTNLRQAADHLMTLRHHPLEEVRTVAETIENALIEHYPSSFSKKRYEGTEAYNTELMQKNYYLSPFPMAQEAKHGVVCSNNSINTGLLASYKDTLASRPQHTELPKFLAECGTMQFTFGLDFGSFRDIQRHRAVVQRMPLLTTFYGFEPWYLEQIPQPLAEEALALLEAQQQILTTAGISDELRQYYLPMGLRVGCRLTGDLPALVYLVERRANIDVHPTLRVIAQGIGEYLTQNLGNLGLKIYTNLEGDRFNYNRGKQDIVEK